MWQLLVLHLITNKMSSVNLWPITVLKPDFVQSRVSDFVCRYIDLQVSLEDCWSSHTETGTKKGYAQGFWFSVCTINEKGKKTAMAICSKSKNKFLTLAFCHSFHNVTLKVRTVPLILHVKVCLLVLESSSVWVKKGCLKPFVAPEGAVWKAIHSLKK